MIPRRHGDAKMCLALRVCAWGVRAEVKSVKVGSYFRKTISEEGATTECRATFNHGPNEPVKSGPAFCSLARGERRKLTQVRIKVNQNTLGRA